MDAFTALYREELSRLVAGLVSMVGGLQAAEEVAQEAFEAALVQCRRPAGRPARAPG